MNRVIVYFAALFALQVIVGLVLEGLPTSPGFELGLVVAAPVAALVVARPRDLRAGWAKLATVVVPHYLALVAVSAALLVAGGAIIVLLPSEAAYSAQSVIAATLEEFAFRVLPFLILFGDRRASSYPSRTQVALVVALSAVVFTVGHDSSSWILVVDKLTYAVVAAYLFLRTGNPWLLACLHATTNLIAILYFSLAEVPQHGTFVALSLSVIFVVLALSSPRITGSSRARGQEVFLSPTLGSKAIR